MADKTKLEKSSVKKASKPAARKKKSLNNPAGNPKYKKTKKVKKGSKGKIKGLKANAKSQPSKKDNSSVSSSRNSLVSAVIVGLLILLCIVFLMSINSGKSADLGDIKLKNINTYSLIDGSEKKKEKEFRRGASIQVGLKYNIDKEDEAEYLKYVVLKKDTNEEVYSTNLFKLQPVREELFVNIKSKDLGVGEYAVELKDNEDNKIVDLEFSIVE